jgi:23S rRNA pseudouridine1911/1915/1917 synthase
MSDALEEGKQELFEHYHIDVDGKQEPLRIDKFLINRLERVTRNKVQQAVRAGNVLVDDKTIKPSFKIKPGNSIKVMLPKPLTTHEITPQQMDLDILYEDADLLVLNKPAGLVVHPGVGNWDGTLVNGLAHHFQQTGAKKGALTTEDERPGLVHRIDKDTTGLMVVGKTDYAVANLAKQFFDRTVGRRYVALVWGDVAEDEGVIDMHIGRSKRHRSQQDTFPEGLEGKHAITHYKVLERYHYVTLVECRLETGRTHQIRVHFKALGNPLFGDATYGGDKIVKGTVYTKYKQFVGNCFKILPRQALHAKTLRFVHPTTEEEMSFDSPLPNDLQEVVEKWDHYVRNLKRTE